MKSNLGTKRQLPLVVNLKGIEPGSSGTFEGVKKRHKNVERGRNLTKIHLPKKGVGGAPRRFSQEVGPAINFEVTKL